jgi:methyltransferase (TIGR00027 family)
MLDRSLALPRSVADTARLVAAFRARETERPDALFRDPFARALAGPEGDAMLRALPWSRIVAGIVVQRTVIFDEMIFRAVTRDRFDTILSLGAGLDARPYRLSLPPETSWIEVDLPDVLSLKEATLGGSRASCRVTRFGLDLARRADRCAIFDEVCSVASRVLVVTEGLLMYLAPDDVASLAEDLHGRIRCEQWLTDLVSPMAARMMRLLVRQLFSRGDTEIRFAPAVGGAFFERYGWKVIDSRSAVGEAFQMGRLFEAFHSWSKSRASRDGLTRALRGSGTVLLRRG